MYRVVCDSESRWMHIIERVEFETKQSNWVEIEMRRIDHRCQQENSAFVMDGGGAGAVECREQLGGTLRVRGSARHAKKSAFEKQRAL
jgi:hypothetical protein